MEIFQKISRKTRSVLEKPKLLIIKPLQALSPYLSDELFLKCMFRLKVGYTLDLKTPLTFNEKLQWLKLNYRIPFLSKLVDKYEVKEYVSSKLGEGFIIKSFGVWNSFEDIDFSSLPDKFVLKTTHDSGGVVICNNKEQFDVAAAKIKINRHLKINHYYRSREWPYKNVVPRILAEEYLVDESGSELKDYKFFCFDGEPKFLFIATDRNSGDVKFDFFDLDFNHLDIEQVHEQSNKVISKPLNFDKMIELARSLSQGLPHVRIDFYNVNGNILFGEYTFFHHDGLVPFKNRDWDFILGEYIQLPPVSK